jgi:hypothetical protein
MHRNGDRFTSSRPTAGMEHGTWRIRKISGISTEHRSHLSMRSRVDEHAAWYMARYTHGLTTGVR